MVELIVVVAIIGLVLIISIPYFGGAMRRARLTSEARQIFMPLLKARLEAIKRGNNINVEISTDSSKTSYRTALVFIDNATGSVGSYNASDPDTLVMTFPMAPNADSALRIDVLNAPSPSTAATTIDFIFTPLGTLAAASTSKAAYISDGKGNLLQVAVPSTSNAKATITKQLVGANYVGQPWTWF
jgi:type II secretory pathway pseudopilin PulG